MNTEWKSRYEVAVETAQQAGQLALRYFDSDLLVETKTDQTPVTIADRETETYLRSTLLKAFPNDGFLGEEHGEQPGSSGFRWIIDPIDGTRNFVRGIPLWATLVALEYKGEQIAGVASVPALGHTYRALRGDGAYRGTRRLHVSGATELREALVLYSSLTWFHPAPIREAFLRLGAQAQLLRGFGDFFGYLLLAQGSAEIMMEHGIHPWDVAAMKVLVEEAGGRFTDWAGNATIHQPDAIASNGRLHEQALALLGAHGSNTGEWTA
jgi:histidinol-phosphatase